MTRSTYSTYSRSRSLVKFTKPRRRSTVKPLTSSDCLSCGRPVPDCTGGIRVFRGRERRICRSCLE